MAKAPDNENNTLPEADNTKTAEIKENNIPDNEATQDEALESFLNRAQDEKEDEKAPQKKGKLSRGAIGLIIGIVVVAALIIAVVVAVTQPQKKADDEEMYDKPVEMATIVDEKGEHHVEIATDEDGEIARNGYGELVSYLPAQIKKIEVENTAGSFTVNSSTPEGQETVYTITGFEGYDLRAGMADAVANDAASLSFTTVAAVGGNLADYGLDKPRATVKVTYTDKTTAVFRVGNEADGGAGTFAALGEENNVYLVADDAVDSFLYNVLDMISYEITAKAESVEDDSFSKIELSGSKFSDPITIVPNEDEAIMADYRLTKPYEMFADDYEGNDISGSIRDLYAESVVSVNPSDGQLSSFGVKEPYAKIHAVYPDTEITLSCSKQAGDGLVNVYNPDKGIIYTIRIDALGWATTDIDQLLPKTVIELNRDVISRIVVSSANKEYTIDLTHTTDTAINEDGEKEQVAGLEARMKGELIPEGNFQVFFQNFNIMNNLGRVKNTGNQPAYQWRVSYTNGRADDIIAVYDSSDKSCPVTLNGEVIGSVSKSHLNALKQDILDVAANKTPKSL